MKEYSFERFMKERKPYNFSIYENKKEKRCDNIFCFDIEVTSYYVYGGAVFSLAQVFELCRYDCDEVEKFFKECKFGALCYIWQFTIDGEVVIIGRELRDFATLVTRLNMIIGAKWVCFCHNFHYEYHFIREILKFDKVFFTEMRKPLYAQIDNLEFRCTYRLTNLSLAKWGEQNGVQKKVGDLDYTKMRTPYTDITEKEKQYCIYDLLVMVQGLKQYKSEYVHIHDIPYTLTGTIRRPVKQLYANDFKFKNFVASMMPRNYEEFLVQSNTFGGGYVASNVRYTNALLHGLISKDIASAYPFKVFIEKYPSAPFTKVNAPCNWYDCNAHICLVEFQALENIDDICPMPSSKRIYAQGLIYDEYERKKDAITLNNGKVRKAKKIAIYCTENDFYIYSLFYKFEKAKVLSHWIAPKDYIDIRFILLMLTLYKNKTELKGVDPEIYLQSKAKLNSMSYGLMATAPCRDQYYEDEDYKPHTTKCTEAMGNAQLLEFQDKPWKNVVPYCWGLYVTSYQRKRVLSMAKKFSDKNGHNRTVYIDTDSEKGFFNAEDLQIFEDDNEATRKRIMEVCNERSIDPYLVSPKDKDGVVHTMGLWEDDGSYTDFKTMHAKCYAYKESENDRVHITIAGVPKNCADVLQKVDDLRNGLTFDIFHSRKNITTYLDGDNPQVTMPDGYKVTYKCGINLHPTSYKLTLTEQYKELLIAYGNKRNLGAV